MRSCRRPGLVARGCWEEPRSEGHAAGGGAGRPSRTQAGDLGNERLVI